VLVLCKNLAQKILQNELLDTYQHLS